jgi:DNA-binding XRE family transcriptional regulator
MNIIDKTKLIRRMEALNDMTAEELATKAGCTAPTIYNIKKGKNCNRQTAKRIAAALKCHLEDLA